MPTSPFDDLYRALLTEILERGQPRHDRTGVGTWAVFGRTLDMDLQRGFPLLNLRRLSFRMALLEQIWMLRGITNSQWLQDRDVRIWQAWADPEGSLGPTTGAQWRHWHAPNGDRRDQVLALLAGLRERPHSRRHLLNAWNVSDLPDERVSPQANVSQGRMALAPCLVTHQFHVEGDQLSLLVHQRSADTLLGLPLDVAGSALLVHLFARALDLKPHRLLMVLGDVHLYANHREQAMELVSRESRPAPRLVFHTPPKAPFDYDEADVRMTDYDPHPPLTAPVAV